MLLPFIVISIALFMLGAALGSFLNVVIYRSVTDESWVTGRSKCENCGRLIQWYDNIPIFSYLFLRGKCRRCGDSIALTHPVVEFIAGSLFVWWYWGGSLFFQLTQQPFQVLQPLFWLIVGVLLLFIFVTDLLYLIIPDVAVGLLLVMTLAYRLTLTVYGVMQPSDFAFAMLGVVIAVALFVGLWAATKGRGMGLGDVKLAAPMALLLGWPNIIVGLFLSFVIGALVGVALILGGRKRFGQVIPFGPFMVLGIVVTLLWGDWLLHWYLSWL